MSEEIKKAKFTLNYRYSIQENRETGVVTCLPEVRELISSEEIDKDEIKYLANLFKQQYAFRNEVDFKDILCLVKLEKIEYVVENYSES